MNVSAVIVAAGKGERINRFKKKQFLSLCAKPLLYWTLEMFQKIRKIKEIVLVLPKEDIPEYKKSIEKEFSKVKKIIAGGETRQESVFNGLKNTEEIFPLVAIHDGVRPLVSTNLIERTLRIAKKHGTAVTALPVKETLKMVSPGNLVKTTLPREKIWAIQTPQVFRREIILQAHQKARKDKFTGTDDAQLVERLGLPVKLVPGEYTNIKITTPEDLLFAQTILKMRMNANKKSRIFANKIRANSFS